MTEFRANAAMGKCVRGRRDLVGDPVGVPRPAVRRVVGEQVRVASQPDADRGQGFPDLTQVACDQGASVRVDGEPAVLVGLGVLADALPAAHDIVEGDVHRATGEVEVADLQAAELAAAHAGDDDEP